MNLVKRNVIQEVSMSFPYMERKVVTNMRASSKVFLPVPATSITLIASLWMRGHSTNYRVTVAASSSPFVKSYVLSSPSNSHSSEEQHVGPCEVLPGHLSRPEDPEHGQEHQGQQ